MHANTELLSALCSLPRAEAMAAFMRLVDAAHAGHTDFLPDEQLVSRFISQYRSRDTKQGYSRDLAWLKQWLANHFIQPVPFRELSPQIASEVISQLHQQVEAQQLSPATANRRLAAWSSFWTWASEPQRHALTGILRSPWPRRAWLPTTRPERSLDTQDLMAVLDAVQAAAEAGDRSAHRDLVMIQMLFLLGVRVSELAHIRWGDVERVSDGGLVTITAGKGGTSRVIRVSTNTLDLIESLGRGSSHQWLFPGRNGRPLCRQSIGDRLTVWGKRVGVRLHCHLLRHAHASEAVKRGVDPFLLARTLGHKSLDGTAVYVHPEVTRSSSLLLG